MRTSPLDAPDRALLQTRQPDERWSTVRLVSAAAALHGRACSRGRPGSARALAVASLVDSNRGVVLLATGLPPT
ncbi:hypothetical protein AB0A70_28260 [Streptomyces morookaense]|uniref:hypothetical protein n=1 Tax=Streptomyces morookaense TaxID=1970 RepID=UPI00340DEC8E